MPNPPRETKITRLYRDASRVYRAQVRILKEAHEVRLGRLLYRRNGLRLKAKISLVVLCHLAQ